MRERLGLVTATLAEDIAGMRVVQSFTREPVQERAFRGVNDRYRGANYETVVLNGIYFRVHLAAPDLHRHAAQHLQPVVGLLHVLRSQDDVAHRASCATAGTATRRLRPTELQVNRRSSWA